MRGRDADDEDVDVDGHMKMLAKVRADADSGRRTRKDEAELNQLRVGQDTDVQAGLERAEPLPDKGRVSRQRAPRRSGRLRTLRQRAAVAAASTGTAEPGRRLCGGSVYPPRDELEHLLDASHLLCCASGRYSKAGACDGGDPGLFPGLVAGSYPRSRPLSRRGAGGIAPLGM